MKNLFELVVGIIKAHLSVALSGDADVAGIRAVWVLQECLALLKSARLLDEEGEEECLAVLDAATDEPEAFMTEDVMKAISSRFTREEIAIEDITDFYKDSVLAEFDFEHGNGVDGIDGFDTAIRQDICLEIFEAMDLPYWPMMSVQVDDFDLDSWESWFTSYKLYPYSNLPDEEVWEKVRERLSSTVGVFCHNINMFWNRECLNA